MKKKKTNNNNNKKNRSSLKGKFDYFSLPDKTKKWTGGVAMMVLAILMGLGFFGMAGWAGDGLILLLVALIGKTAVFLPAIFFLGGLVFFVARHDNFFGPLAVAMTVLVLALSGLIAGLDIGLNPSQGGYLGYFLAYPLISLFGFWVTLIIFIAACMVSAMIFWWLLGQPVPDFSDLEKTKEKKPIFTGRKKKSFLNSVLHKPDFKTKEIPLPNVFSQRKTTSNTKEKESRTEEKIKRPVGLPKTTEYKAPPLDLLDARRFNPHGGDLRQDSIIIKKTLENFGIPVEMGEPTVGPAVTQYTLKPAQGIKLSKITALASDLSLALASSSIRIEAPIPGKALVGVEVPNRERAQVGLKELVASSKFRQNQASLLICLGKDVMGDPIYADISRMPHLMVAGATGTGKTIFLNSMITSLLYRNPPEMLRFILVDPKRVEMRSYNNLPHLLTPVIFDVHKTVAALKWAIGEMDRRFDVLSQKESRNILSYNEKALKDGEEPLPYILFVIDELADLMAAKGKEVEAGIIRLAQMARAVGIHLVVATQRPSVEVITGLIKANITCRVAFQVASQFDSRTILDISGAEKLLGMGDMLFTSAEYPKPKRLQGPYISEKETKKVLDYIKDNNPKYEYEIDEGVLESMAFEGSSRGGEFNGNGTMFGVLDGAESGFGEDPLYEQAKKEVIAARKASASFLQRRLRVGYARAARLIDILEERGVVGPGEGAKPREVLVSQSEDQVLEEQPPEDGWEKV